MNGSEILEIPMHFFVSLTPSTGSLLLPFAASQDRITEGIVTRMRGNRSAGSVALAR